MITSEKYLKLVNNRNDHAKLEKLINSMDPDDKKALIKGILPDYQLQRPAVYSEAVMRAVDITDNTTLDTMLMTLIEGTDEKKQPINPEAELIDAMTNAIINNLHGQREPITCFEYVGAYDSYDKVPKGRKGIYIFTVEEEITLTKEMYKKYNDARNWDLSTVGASFNGDFYSPITVGTVFYLGKSSGKGSSVYKRLKVHFGERTNSATNGIKMKMPERSFVDGKLKAHVFLFDKKNENTILIDGVEKKLHERLRPITGGSQ